MASFRDTLEKEMVTAAKTRDKDRLSALRMVMAALKNKEIDLHRGLTEAEALQLLSGLVKQRKDSIEQFAKGGRNDLVEKETRELRLIQAFMPAQMTEEELVREVEQAVTETGAASVRDMGKVMKVLMPKLAGRVDGKLLNEKVKARLSAAS
ncbi:MAG TPA: GatB/YqeY domain-containing protein [Syntrophales bacterium]|nr:GatB/YqeY domain-containing protein [Syntrophales bacterium]